MLSEKYSQGNCGTAKVYSASIVHHIFLIPPPPPPPPIYKNMRHVYQTMKKYLLVKDKVKIYILKHLNGNNKKMHNY